jgi:hypothetical protein
MRCASTNALFAIALVSFAAPASTRAQTIEGVDDTRTLSTCIAEHQTHLTRIVGLIDEAEARMSSSDSRVAADARESLVTLMIRAHDIREHLHRCVERAHIPRPDTTDTRVEEESDAAADSVAADHGTVHAVESDASLGEHVRIVRGERVDGTGTASDASVRSGVHAIGDRLARCYDGYVDRVGTAHGDVVLSFTLRGAGRPSVVDVEAGSFFDSTLHGCVETAAREIRVAGATGRSVYSYTFSLGPER